MAAEQMAESDKQSHGGRDLAHGRPPTPRTHEPGLTRTEAGITRTDTGAVRADTGVPRANTAMVRAESGFVRAPEPAQLPAARPLDSIDRSILRLLQEDGRASIRSVADRVHVSRANAYARINRLIDSGVIRGFTAHIDHERAGQGASAYITLKIVQNSWRSVREQLLALPGAAHIALVSGDFDVLLLVHTADNRALRELVLTRIQSMPEILSTHTLLVFEETEVAVKEWA